MKLYRLYVVLLCLLLLCACDHQRSIPMSDALKEKESTEAPQQGDEDFEKPAPRQAEKDSEKAAPQKSTAGLDALPNDLSGWGFVKHAGGYPEFTAAQRAMMKQYDVIYEGSHEGGALYLTFDEGYENGYTSAILDTLKEKGVPAAFFVTGPYIERNKELVQRMLEEGHTVGNHTVHHPTMPSLTTADAMQEEMLALDRMFYESFGCHMSYFRPPEGAYSERSLAATNALGYRSVLWSFAYRDWETDKQQGAAYALDSVAPYLHSGCVILLHAVSQDNAAALGDIIDAARAKGYTFESLDNFVPLD